MKNEDNGSNGTSSFHSIASNPNFEISGTFSVSLGLFFFLVGKTLCVCVCVCFFRLALNFMELYCTISLVSI